MIKRLTLLICGFSILLLFPLGINTNSYVGIIEEDGSWHFIALGDTRNLGPNLTNPVRAGITNHIVNNNPNAEFVVHSGDLVYYGAEQDDWNRYYEDIENATKANVTYYYAVGNHERYSYNDPDGSYGPTEYDCSTYMQNVELPGNERFYSFDHDGIHFVFINTEEDWTGAFDITTEQETWLINDLANHTDDFIVAVFHRPLYSVRSSSRVADAQAVRSVLRPIFIYYGVDLAISGHDHYYYRTFRDNIMYVATGGGGANLATNGDTTEWQEGDVYYSVYQYMNFTISNDVLIANILEWDEFTQETSIIDSFEMSLGVRNTTETTTTSADTTTESTSTTSGVSITGTSTTTSQNTTNFQYYQVISMISLLLIGKNRKKSK